MKSLLVRKPLTVKKSPIQGYGVFADEAIFKGDIIEESYSLLLSHRDDLNNYFFAAGEKSALALGFGSIYNHSKTPNADYEFNEALSIITFTASQDIAPNEEILIDYGKDYFSTREMKIIEPTLLFKLRKCMPLISLLSRFAFVVTGIIFACALLNK